MISIVLELVGTGIEGLDRLLSGGFVKGSTVLVSGQYGVGKTLFALQYAFHQASKGDKVLYVSTSEPVFKVKQYAGDLSFYDEALLRTGFRDVSEEGVPVHRGSLEFVESSLGEIAGYHRKGGGSIIDDIRETVEGKGVQHLIIDPITAITMLYEDETAMRKDLLLLGAWLSRLGCTVLLMAEESDPRLLDVERYLADCVIALSSETSGSEREFYVDVVKLRGNRQQMGRHLYSPGRDGIMVIPDMTMVEPSEKGEASTGIPGLDSIIGGLEYGSSWIIGIDDLFHYELVFSSLLSAAYQAGEGIVYSPPSKLSFGLIDRHLKRYDVDVPGMCRAGRAFFIDYFGKSVPDDLKPYVIESYPDVEDLRIFSKEYSATGAGKLRWRILSNLNVEYHIYGRSRLRDRYSMTVTKTQERGNLFFGYCNFNEIDEDIGAFLRTSCDGIMELYVKDKYPCVRISKSPSGVMSGEYVLVSQERKPYVKLMRK